MCPLAVSPEHPDRDLKGAAGEAADLHMMVARLVEAGVLAAGSRRHRLLDYLVAHHLSAPTGTKLKEYAIAVDVLGRSEGFDPGTDGIVRVEIARLRQALDAHFDGPGRDAPVQIRIPRGQYEIEVTAGPARTVPDRAFPRRVGRAAAALVGLVAAAGIALALAPTILRKAPAAGVPLIRLAPFEDRRPATDLSYPADGLAGFLAAELAHFRTLRVALSGGELPEDAAADFVLEGSLDPAEEGSVLHLRLVRGRDRSLVWSSDLALGADDMRGAEALHVQLDALVVQLAGPLGAIDSEGRARIKASRLDWRKGHVSDFQCYLMFQSFDLTKDAADRARARTCLSALVAEASGVGQIWAAGAFMLFLDWSEAGRDRSPAVLEAALTAANRAVFLDPTGADGYQALASILTALERFDEADAALARAAELNPRDPEIRIKRGWLECLTGDWEGGEARIRAVLEDFPVAPGWYRIPLALGAFRRSDVETFAAEADRIVESGDPRGLVLKLAAARLADDRATADRAEARLAARNTTVARAVDEIATVFPDAGLVATLGEMLRPGGVN